MERVFYCLCNCSLMEVCTTLCGDGWCGVSMLSMKEGEETWINGSSKGRREQTQES
jgi:hypothetical protein